jgi:hypothetical protein
MKIDLDAEYFAALRRMRQLDAEPWPGVGLIRIKVSGQRYEPAPHGFDAFILPEVDDDIIIDLITWRVGHPQRWWQRNGNASVLGADNFRAAKFLGEPPVLQPTPERWLVEGGRGCVLLEGNVDLIAEFPLVRCRSTPHKRQLERELVRRALARLPKFEVRADL